jgi:hypothetical protein
MSSAKRTIDHVEIREWVEARGGSPARVKRAGDQTDHGIIRIDFPGGAGEESLEAIDWDDWFQAFEESGLAFLYQEATADGSQSRFSKLVKRTAEDEGEGPTRRTRKKGRRPRSGSPA